MKAITKNGKLHFRLHFETNFFEDQFLKIKLLKIQKFVQNGRNVDLFLKKIQEPNTRVI